MGILSTPNRGQPLDVDYIAQIATQVNQLTTLVGDRSSSFSSVNDVSVKTSDMKFFAKTVNVFASTNKTDGDAVDYTVSYPPFNGNPIVTATIVSGASSTIGDDATVVMKNISSSNCTFRITFNTGGNLDIFVNIIAIGFPVLS
jgi:hypothetical protein